MAQTNRYIFYIDGFNLYHVIDRFKPYCKWLNLDQFSRSLISKTGKIENIYYFSAIAEWKPDRANRHKTYIEALKTKNIKVILGKFKEKDRKCKKCGINYKAHEEKQTDVNIALQIMEDAINNRFDTAILVSGDTDFLPVIRKVKLLYPEKRIGIVLPIGAHAESLKAETDFHIKLKLMHLINNQFPEIIKTINGEIAIPKQWKLPK